MTFGENAISTMHLKYMYIYINNLYEKTKEKMHYLLDDQQAWGYTTRVFHFFTQGFDSSWQKSHPDSLRLTAGLHCFSRLKTGVVKENPY